ncbi:hypothetical protein ACGC1H_006426 [Rhizoctonia solani]
MSLLISISRDTFITPAERYEEIIEELDKASYLLSFAIERYAQACASVAHSFESGGGAAKALLSSAKKELSALASYDQNYQRAKVSLRRVRNRCPELVPIHILPSEILSQIFCSVDYCCISKQAVELCKSRNTSTTPETYLEVCSWWRRVAMESSYLWTHIDLICLCSFQAFDQQHNVRALQRAMAFATQAGRASLDIHIGAGSAYENIKDIDRELVDFCASASSRIQSLDMACSSSPIAIQNLLGTLLHSGLVPGTVTRFCISNGVTQRGTARGYSILVTRKADESRLEDFLRPITRLQLNCVFLPWTSRAYHGLVELKLIAGLGQGVGLIIPEGQLASILRASPGLQLLHYGLEVERKKKPYRLDPVRLDDLEVFRLEKLHADSQASVLQMIIPGNKPLQVAIKLRDNLTLEAPHHTALSAFLSRSFGVQLYIEGIGSKLELFELFQESSAIDILVLRDFIIGAKYIDPRNTRNYPQIHVLHVILCKLVCDGFENLIEFHSVQELTSHFSSFTSVSGDVIRTDRYYEEDLRDICPSVSFLNDDRHYLAEGW